MRIGVVMAIGSPWSFDTAMRLAAQGDEVHVIDFSTPVDHGDSYIGVGDATYEANLLHLRASCAGVHFLSATHPSLRYVLAAPQLLTILRSVGADVLLTLYGGGFAALALASGFRPYACYVVGSDVLMQNGGAKAWLSRRALARASSVFANGEYLARRTRELAPGARVIPLLLGIDPEVFRPAESVGAPVEMVCTRGFMPVYNNEAIIKALALLPTTAPSFRMTFTSPGPQLADAKALADAVLKGPARQRVRFLGGVARAELVEILRSADVYLSVSRSDGTSTALLEALSCGLFPVLSDIPQHHEWLAGDNAILSPLDDDQYLASAILTALSDGQRRLRARAVNRALILERADASKTSAALAAELRTVIASRGRAA